MHIAANILLLSNIKCLILLVKLALQLPTEYQIRWKVMLPMYQGNQLNYLMRGATAMNFKFSKNDGKKENIPQLKKESSNSFCKIDSFLKSKKD